MNFWFGNPLSILKSLVYALLDLSFDIFLLVVVLLLIVGGLLAVYFTPGE